jgi:trimeric autotransporter adhesin
MKTLKRFWGVALIVVLLASMLVSAVPASAGNYTVSDSLVTPGSAGDLSSTLGAAGFGVVDVAQSNNAIYFTSRIGVAGLNGLYKSVDGGVTYVPCLAAGIPNVAATNFWNLVAVAPDDINTVVVIDATAGFTNKVYYSSNGGVSFINLPGNTGAIIHSVAISPLAVNRYIVVGGESGALAEAGNTDVLDQFTLPATAGTWVTAPVSAGLVAVAVPATQSVLAVGFSPNFNSDQAMYTVTLTYGAAAGAVLGKVTVNYFNYNNNAWDAAVDAAYPKLLKASAAIGTQFTATKASFAFDAGFSLDEATQIAFIAADIQSPAATVVGGLYRFSDAAALSALSTGSVAWDGTNLMTADWVAAQPASAANVGAIVRRSTTALGVAPLLLANSTLKWPSTGYNTKVLFNNGVAYAFSQGTNGGIAKSLDFGKTWNGYKYLNTTFATVTSTWLSPDASTKYAVVDDGVDLNVWRQDGTQWQRVLTIAAGVGSTYLVRADDAVPASVWIGLTSGGAKQMYRSTDGFNSIWASRPSNQTIADFAVQTADTVYVAVAGAAAVIKTTNGGRIWSNPVVAMPWIGGGNAYSITLLSDDHVIVGGTTGGVAYTADGSTWTALVTNAAGGNTVVTATGLATGDTLFAVNSGVGKVSKWQLGTNVAAWTAGQLINGAAVGIGIALSNNVLYVLDDVGNNLYRFLNPTISVAATTDIYAAAFAMGTNVNIISGATTAGTTTTIWTVDTVGAAADTMLFYADYLTSTTTVPTLVYPLAGTIIPVNSIAGNVANFTFKWNAPAVTTVPATAYTYTITVYLDEAGTIPVCTTAAAAGVLNFPVAFNSATAGFAFTGAVGVAQPGTIYYWRVATTSLLPAVSQWSEMQSFSIQQLQAIVPVLTSPSNGFSYVHGMAPAFSWNPIAGASTYKFEVSADATFATTLYSTTTASAGASVPSTVKLADNTNYYWRVKALTPAEGDWSAVSNFSIAAAVITTVPPTQAPPTLTVVLPPVTTTSIVIPPATTTTTEVNPSYIWAIIIIGAVLVIAVIVLIVRTRRSV